MFDSDWLRPLGRRAVNGGYRNKRELSASLDMADQLTRAPAGIIILTMGKNAPATTRLVDAGQAADRSARDPPQCQLPQ